MEYIHLIPDGELALLRSLMGFPVCLLYTRSVEVYDWGVVACDFSLDLRTHRYLVIESDWGDTPQTGIDYHMIHLALQDWPKGVDRVRSDEGIEFLEQPSVVHLRIPASPLSSVKILAHRESRGSEVVHYDQALIFTRADGYRFSLAAHQSIAGGLEFTDDEGLIEHLLRDFPERRSVG